MTPAPHPLDRLIAFLIAAILLAGAAPAPAAEKPNILFIYSDDHAAHAIGAYGGRLASLDPTPTLDRLARGGMLFENAFCTNSICVPARATILTGQYSHQSGIRTLSGRLEAARQHLPRLIGEAGYETAIIGKWHLAEEPAAFDYYCVLPGQGSYFNPVLREKGNWPETKRFAGYDSKHSTDVITDLSLAWLRKRDRSRPFFLMHQFKAPHDNFENAERYDWLYDDVDIPEPHTLWATPNHGSVATEGQGTSVGKRNERRNMGHHMFVDPALPDDVYKKTAYQRYLKKYLRCVRGVDDAVARLLDHLESTGELANTVVVYTSDQGFMLGEHDYIDKRWMYEESLRIPLIVSWPGVVRPGSREEALIDNTDIAPTLLAIAGVEAPKFMRGRSIVPFLRGSPPDDWRTATYYRYWMHLAHHDNPAHFGIRTAEYKLIFFYGLPLDAEGAEPRVTPSGWELYDLREDPYESRNVWEDPRYASVRGDLRRRLITLREEVGDTDQNHPEVLERLHAE